MKTRSNMVSDDIIVQSYVEINHACKNNGIGIGIIEGTDDLFIERFMKVAGENVTLTSFTCFNAAKDIDRSETDSEAVKRFYIEKLKFGLKKNLNFRKLFEPMIHDFPIFTGVSKRVLEL